MWETDATMDPQAMTRRWYRRPRQLRVGDTVGIVAPSSPVDPARLERGIELLTARGYHVKVGRHVFGRSTLFAATDRDRAEDICRMLEDPSVAAIFCARGGYGSQRLLPMIASLVEQVEPKCLIGYSDITALHSLCQRAGWVTVHGPMPGDWVGQPDGGFSVNALFSLLSGSVQSAIPLPSDVRPEVVQPGRARGRLVGGNLSLIAALLGTPYEAQTADAILFLEDVGEAPYRVDRMLSSLQLAGKFRSIRGVILGDFTDCVPQQGAPPVAVEDVLRSHFGAMGVPVVMGYPAGHGRVNVPLPLGHEVELDADTGTVLLTTSPVAT